MKLLDSDDTAETKEDQPRDMSESNLLPSPREGDLTTRRRIRGVRYAAASTYKRKKKASQVSLKSVMQRVSHKAALSTKKAVWDSNQVSVDAALRAVDQWEALYRFLRRFTILTISQAQHLYQATKLGASQMEKGILRPVRDWIVLPAFGGLEQAILFLQSDRAKSVARQWLEFARRIPLLGEHVICPGLVLTGGLVRRTWQILQYPIPSKHQVRSSVDWALTTSKWAVLTLGREFTFFFKRADANITRTLSHTQWKVLGSGPYATVDDVTKQHILTHITERYCSLHPLWTMAMSEDYRESDTEPQATMTGDRRVDHDCILARYELAAHIKRYNLPLYHDLIRSGLLLKRGGPLFQDDEWLMPCPVYRHVESSNFLVPEDEHESLLDDADDNPCVLRPLWFRLRNVNGKPPPRDSPWICFSESDQHELEDRYRRFVRGETLNEKEGGLVSTSLDTENKVKGLSNNSNDNIINPLTTLETSNQHEREAGKKEPTPKHPTIAQWYTPDPETDVFVDQKRHAVTFSLHCRLCKKLVRGKTGQGSDLACLECSTHERVKADKSAIQHSSCFVPPILAIMRPTMWRFHGKGDIVRRSNWFLETPRKGLQPFDEESGEVLEDAYLFLRWMAIKKAPASYEVKAKNETKDATKTGDVLEGALLTVDVTCPDGTDRLVQFGSLTQATAIQKGLSAAVSLNKLRVYRGAWLPKRRNRDVEQVLLQSKPVEIYIQESIDRATGEYGSLGETMVPNTCLRNILKPPPKAQQPVERIDLIAAAAASGNGTSEADLAVPTRRLFQEDMAKHLKDPKGGPIDHLCLIVHGIGEMMQTIGLFGLALPNQSTIVDCCGFLRRNHSEVQMTDLTQIYPTSMAKTLSAASVGRVEYLPIEWHEAFSILSQRRSPTNAVQKAESPDVMLKHLSLPTIPNMREFANDTLMDVLYFMSPQHHDIITDIVATEMNVVVEKFRKLTGFSERVSIIGHSLGSIISWDILANQQLSPKSTGGDELLASDFDGGATLGNKSFGSLVSDYETAACAEDSPEVDIPFSSFSNKVSYSYPQLKFQVETFFLLGSPVAVFLMIRNQRKPLLDTFFLKGCRRVYNIFHPYDPVAYRIEPCIDPRNADFEPSIIKHWNGGFRVQYQTKRFWRKLVDTTWETQQNVAEAFEASMAGMGLLDTDPGDVDEVEMNDFTQNNYVATGQLNRGRRIDYMLQEKEIENASEYVAALAAHSCYWTEKDLSLFIAQQISLRTIDASSGSVDGDAWDLDSGVD